MIFQREIFAFIQIISMQLVVAKCMLYGYIYFGVLKQIYKSFYRFRGPIMQLTMFQVINFNANDFKKSLLYESRVPSVLSCSRYEFYSILGLLDIQMLYCQSKYSGFSNSKINSNESFQLHRNYTFYQSFNRRQNSFIYSTNVQPQYLLNRSTFSLTQNNTNLSLMNIAILKWRMIKNIVNYNLKICCSEKIVLQIQLDSYLSDAHSVFLFCLESQLSLKNSVKAYLSYIKKQRKLIPIPRMSDRYFMKRKNMPLNFILIGLNYSELMQYLPQNILESLLDMYRGYKLQKIRSDKQFFVLKAKGYLQLMQFVKLLDQVSKYHLKSSIKVIPISYQIQFQNFYECQKAQNKTTADGVQCQGNGRILIFKDLPQAAKYFLFYSEVDPYVEVHY